MSRDAGTQPAPHPVAPHEPAGAQAVAGVLGIVLLAALLVGGTWRYTRQTIADNVARRTLAEISRVLPADLHDNAPHRDVLYLDTGDGRPGPVYRAQRNGVPTAAVFTVVAPDGYVGPIRLMVGLSADGRILGVQVTAHSETPGIGATIADEASGWLTAFSGRSLLDPPEARWALRTEAGEFDAIAGATVSSRAVVGGVRQALQFFAAHRDEILAPPASPPPPTPPPPP